MNYLNNLNLKFEISGSLLGEIHQNLRGVSYFFNNNFIQIVSYYHGEINEDYLESVDFCLSMLVGTYHEYLVQKKLKIDWLAVRCDKPNILKNLGVWVLLKKEEIVDDARFKFEYTDEEIDYLKREESKLRMSIINALIGEITPNLRRVKFQLSNDSIEIKSYFDKEIDFLDLKKLEQSIFKEFESKFSVQWNGVIMDSPLKIESFGQCVYARKEIL